MSVIRAENIPSWRDDGNHFDYEVHLNPADLERIRHGVSPFTNGTLDVVKDSWNLAAPGDGGPGERPGSAPLRIRRREPPGSRRPTPGT